MAAATGGVHERGGDGAILKTQIDQRLYVCMYVCMYEDALI